MRIRALALLLISLLVLSCSSSDDGPAADAEPSVADTATDVEESTDAGGTIPTEPTVVTGIRGPANAAAAIETMMALLNGAAIDIDQYERIFNPTFRSAVSYDDFLIPLADLVPVGPWTVVDEPVVSGESGAVTIESPNSPDLLEISAQVDIASATIVSLFLAPITDPAELASVDDAVGRLKELGDLHLLVATVGDVTEARCVPTRNEFGIDVMPLASIFKLYVLGAVVDAIDEGSLTWETPVIIDDSLDSIPSGTTQDVEPGTEMTVRELADLMISISDNTATDHLIATVGRPAVENILVEMGNDSTERNLPFLTTRELFILKADPDLAADYVAADTADRRVLLAGVVAATPLPDLASLDLTTPFLVQELEWFGSPLAVCNALAWLADDPIAAAVLAINPGMPDTDGRWESVLFKGGSEPGLITLAWLTTDADGSRQSTVMGLTAADLLDEASIAEIAAYIRDNS